MAHRDGRVERIGVGDGDGVERAGLVRVRPHLQRLQDGVQVHRQRADLDAVRDLQQGDLSPLSHVRGLSRLQAVRHAPCGATQTVGAAGVQPYAQCPRRKSATLPMYAVEIIVAVILTLLSAVITRIVDSSVQAEKPELRLALMIL